MDDRIVSYFVGIDIGQAQDPTALSVIERVDGRRAWDTWNHMEETPIPNEHRIYDIVHLERLPLGTPYPAMVRTIGQRIGAIPRMGLGWDQEPARVCLVVDGTGVGRPVVDLLTVAGLQPNAITITGGDTVNFEDGYWRVPKRDIVTCTKVFQQQHRLRVAPALPGAALLTKEMENFQYKIDPKTAHDSYGSWRTGTHDDLILSVALPLWFAEHRDSPGWTKATMAMVLGKVAV